MLEPFTFRPIQQPSQKTCATACLSMLLGVPYERILATALRIQPKAAETGLYNPEIFRVARRYGFVLEEDSHTHYSLSYEDSGILAVDVYRKTRLGHKSKKLDYAHVVLLFHGTIYDPEDGQNWHPDAYFSRAWYIRRGLLRIVSRRKPYKRR